MPIWLRNYTFRKLEEHYKKEKEEYDKVKGRQSAKPTVRKPSYSTKARK